MRGRGGGRRQEGEAAFPNQVLAELLGTGQRGSQRAAGELPAEQGGGEGRLPSTLRIKTPVVTRAHSEHRVDINHSAGEDIY